MSLAYIDITLDKPRRLKYGIRDFRDLERVMGKPVGDVLADFAKLGAESLAIICWAGLKHEDRQITPERAADLIDAYLGSGHDVADLRGAINEARVLSGYFGKRAKDEAEAERTDRPSPPAG